jgi:N-acetylglutamate synthase-like GNAT family acetyltransferase
MRVRPATREDIEAFSDLPMKPTLRAWVGEVDGRIIALGGFALANGRWFGFCDLKDEARQYKMTIARAGKRIIAEAKKQGIKFVYAEADRDEPGAVRWLSSLGFSIDPRTTFLYRWRL